MCDKSAFRPIEKDPLWKRAWFTVFGKGNYRWYALFVPMFFVLGISLMTWVLVSNILLNGITISTDTFVAQLSDGIGYKMSAAMLNLIEQLYSIAGWEFAIFGIWIAASILADVTYLLADGYFWVVQCYSSWNRGRHD